MQVKLLVMQLGVLEQLVASFCAEEKVFFGLTMTTVDISQLGTVAPDFNKAKIATASVFCYSGSEIKNRLK
ncbi:ABC transporter B family member 7 [Camellia lanceoleosa]|uniref:ABC transporter B family member 7 n=1 Tax=Camellia lanceoleosa TaxID=1840588 RepID=A0ACC0GTA3_9ERIC|nr:ABC transporter B family member 7 [Camellia lanceoleosa]